MTKSKPKPKTPRSEVVRSIKAAATVLKCTARTLHNWRAEGCPGFEPDGNVDVAQVRRWAEVKLKDRADGSDSKQDKLLEEIRKLRLANDAREGRLVERGWVVERIQRMFGDVNAFRAKSEAEHPTKFAAAAGDVAHCRTIVRGIWDSVMSDLQSLKKHLEEAA